jgi:uncharacterized protein YndB with AHSA1/START domain
MAITAPIEPRRQARFGHFQLESRWHLAAPVGRVWSALQHTESWPRWWPYVRRVTVVREGDARGLGSVRHIDWASRLPYGIAFDVEVVEIEHERLLRGHAIGEVDGEGLWRLKPEGVTTHVHYSWRVVVTRPWMRWVAPIAAPAFRWNHDVVMRAGGLGLAKHLGVTALAIE